MKNEILGYLKIEFQRQTYTSCFVGYFRSLLYITFNCCKINRKKFCVKKDLLFTYCKTVSILI